MRRRILPCPAGAVRRIGPAPDAFARHSVLARSSVASGTGLRLSSRHRGFGQVLSKHSWWRFAPIGFAAERSSASPRLTLSAREFDGVPAYVHGQLDLGP